MSDSDARMDRNDCLSCGKQYDRNTMLFNSFEFLCFFIVVATAYYMPLFRRFQVSILIVSSLCFYAFGAGHLLLLLVACICINTVAVIIANSQPSRAEITTRLGIAYNVIALVFFKYMHLISSIFCLRLGFIVTLPIGISFYTFEGISLLVDNQKKLFTPSKSKFRQLQDISLFISFFPHLISGPILRARDFLPQIGEKRFRDIEWELAFRYLVLGYFFKVFIADNLVDLTWSITSFESFAGTANCIIMLVCYSAEIFADFAGYSFIAFGLAIILGYNIPRNFDVPYLATTLGEFWQRWHQSLSSWIRDYLFIPLGGSKCGVVRTLFNVLLVMTIGGLWHGAAWNYALWGLYHGVGLVVEHSLIRLTTGRDRLKQLFRHPCVVVLRLLITFSFVTCGWLLFFSSDPRVLRAFVHRVVSQPHIPISVSSIAPACLFAAPVFLYHLWHWLRHQNLIAINRVISNEYIRGIILGILLALTILNPGVARPFIYFQF